MPTANQKPKLKAAALAVAVAAAFSPTPSIGVSGLGNFATEATQLLNNVQLLMQTANQTSMLTNQATQIAHELQMINNLVQNTLNVPNYVWGDTMAHLQALANIVKQGQAIAYSLANLDQLFSQRFKDYVAYRTANYGPQSFFTDYQTWYHQQRDGIQGALKAANLQASQFATEEAVMMQLQAMSQTAQGRMQAVQVGNQIAAQQVRQTQKLRELMMAQIQLQSNYMSAQAAKEAARTAQDELLFNAPSGTVRGNGGPGIGGPNSDW